MAYLLRTFRKLVTNPSMQLFFSVSKEADFTFPIGIQENNTFLSLVQNSYLSMKALAYNPFVKGLFFDKSFHQNSGSEYFGFFAFLNKIRKNNIVGKVGLQLKYSKALYYTIGYPSRTALADCADFFYVHVDGPIAHFYPFQV